MHAEAFSHFLTCLHSKQSRANGEVVVAVVENGSSQQPALIAEPSHSPSRRQGFFFCFFLFPPFRSHPFSEDQDGLCVKAGPIEVRAGAASPTGPRSLLGPP